MFNGRNTGVETVSLIASDGFWGSVNVLEFKKQRAIPLQIPNELVESALVYAMQSLDFDLWEVAEKYRKQGIFKAAEIEGTTFNGKNFAQILYEKALFARAKNELLPEFATLSARELHEKRDYVHEQKQLNAEATMAIRSLKGKKRGSVQIL